MNKEEIINDDLLRKYMNPGKTEQAPEGFSAKTMARIMIEKQSVPAKEKFFLRNRVPLISSAVVILLTICAIFVPSGEGGSLGTAVWSYFGEIKIALPAIDNSYFDNSGLPQWLNYGILIILFLAFFDRALYTFFSRRDNSGH